jgi:hypothetical protein
MRGRLLIVGLLIVVFIVGVLYLLDDSSYVLTYKQSKGKPLVIGIDSEFNLSNNTSGSMHNMSNRVTSLSTGDVLSSDGFNDSNLDFCVNDDCVDLDDDSGYYGPSYFIYTSLSDDINVRSLSESSAELLRVSDMKKLVVDGFIGSGGVSSSDSYYFTKSIGDDYQVVEVDKESFLVSNVY